MAQVLLISSDELTFSISLEAAVFSTLIMEKLANNGNIVVVGNYKGNTLGNVVNFLSQVIHGDGAAREKMWSEFLPSAYCELAELFATALAAHDLGIEMLEDLMRKRIAQKIKFMPVFRVRKEFEEDTDLREDQVAFIRYRYRWAFEGAPPPSD